jgi:hypothetical protein
LKKLLTSYNFDKKINCTSFSLQSLETRKNFKGAMQFVTVISPYLANVENMVSS